MQWKLLLINLALAVLPALLRLVSKLAAAMAQAIEQLKQASVASTVARTGGQAPSGGTYNGSNIVGGQTGKKHSTGGEVNHKGEPCLYKPILCQEGYCSECNIMLQGGTDENNLEKPTTGG